MVCELRLRSMGNAVLRRANNRPRCAYNALRFVLGVTVFDTTVLGDYCIVCGISIFNSNAGGLWVTEE